MLAEDDGLAEVRAATSSADLHRLLVTGHLSSRSADYREAAELLRQFHTDDPDRAADTALLLMLNRRWHPYTSKVVADIVTCGVLDDAALDDLANRLLWPDRPTWTHPLSWFGLSWVEFEPGSTKPSRRGRRRDQMVVTSLTEPRGVVRRWAATHLLRRGRTDVESVVARLDGLSSYDADAVVAGIVEAIDHLPEEDAARAIAIGLAAGNSNTRIVTLQALLNRDGAEAAVRLAGRDPSAQVRAWAAKQAPRQQQSPTLFD